MNHFRGLQILSKNSIFRFEMAVSAILWFRVILTLQQPF